MKKNIVILMSLVINSAAFGVLELKQSTSVTIVIGPFTKPSSGDPNTALVLRDDDIHLSKNGAAFGVKNDTTDPAHMDAGMFSCVLNATDTGTLGTLTLICIDPNVDSTDVNDLFTPLYLSVVTANYWDSKYGADTRQVDVTQWSGTNVAAPATAGVPVVNVAYHDNNALATDNMVAFFGNVGAGDPYELFENFFDGTTVSLADVFSDAGTIPDINDAIKTLLPTDFNTVSITAGNLHAHLKASDDNVIVDMNTADLASATVGTVTTLTGHTVSTGDPYDYLTTNLGALGANATEAGGTGDHLTAIDLPNQTMDITGSITGNLSGSVGSIGAGGITTASFTAGSYNNVVMDVNGTDVATAVGTALATFFTSSAQLVDDIITDMVAIAGTDDTSVPTATDTWIAILSHINQRLFAESIQTTTELQQKSFDGTKRYEQTTTKVSATSMTIGEARAND